MTITSQNVKLYKSEVMADTDTGGGRMTSNEVIDGELNNVFDDTSRLDRVYGRSSFRKIFGAIDVSTTEKYLGAHAILTDPPDDGRVAVTILGLTDHAGRRPDAQKYVEQYVLAGPSRTLFMYDSQPAGARSFVCYQHTDDPPPAAGEVLCLSIEKSTDPNYGHQQFVRITELTVANVRVGSSSEYRALYTISINAPLEVNYPGGDLVTDPTLSTSGTRIRSVSLNAGIRYYGVVPLSEGCEPGDATIKVSTILQPVVPASYSETPALDQQLGGNRTAVTPAGPSYTETISATADTAGTLTITLPRAAAPGATTVVATTGSGAWNASFAASGGGVLARSSGGANTTNAAGTISNAAGTIVLNGLQASASYSIAVTYTPSAAISDVAHTDGIEVTLANRGFNWPKTLLPKPAPGTLVVRYRALGVWYELADNGAGQLVGAQGTGAGTVNYLTGTGNPTLGYQPDVGSYVLYGWRTVAHYDDVHADSSIIIGAIDIETEHGIKPGSLSLNWTIGASTYTVEDDGTGDLIGDLVAGSALVDYANKRIRFMPTQVPAKLATLTAEYTALDGDTYTPSPQPTASGGNVAFTIPDAPLEPGAQRIRMQYQYTSGSFSNIRTITITDDGAGNLKFGVRTVGTLNYTSGEVVIDDTLTFSYYGYAPSEGNWNGIAVPFTYFAIVDVSYQQAGSGTAQSDDITLTDLHVDFSDALIDGVISGSVLFDFNGSRYRDNAGTLFTGGSIAPVNSGSIDVGSGIGLISEWSAGARSMTMRALLTAYGRWPLDRVIWSTAGSPLRDQSFQVTDGTNVALADSAGDLQGAANITGHVDADTGVYDVTFDPPLPPETARYNAVILTYLPLDPAILGLDPVRLPLSGTVPVIAQGDTLVIHNTAYTTLTNPLVAGTTYTLPRDRLAYAIVRDQAGVQVPTDRYTENLDDGEITMANPLDLSDYTQPLIVEHRIEDMLLCQDAQLSGLLSIAPGGLTHSYTAGAGTYVSSAKLIGDLQAATTIPFSQTAWTGTWSDSLQGSAPVAVFNNVAHPIAVTDKGTITERFRIEFTGATAFRVYAQASNVDTASFTGTTDADFSPINPLTGEALFTIPWQGWGSGWVAGNQLRFNTIACAAPIQLLRCTLQGPESDPDDSVRIQFRGDKQ